MSRFIWRRDYANLGDPVVLNVGNAIWWIGGIFLVVCVGGFAWLGEWAGVATAALAFGFCVFFPLLNLVRGQVQWQ